MKANRRDFVKWSLGGVVAANSSAMAMRQGKPAASRNISAGKGNKKNVLFIIIEDLRNVLGCYGDPLVKTPNVDRMAKRGVRFDRAYCQYPVCGPSRSSFMTGLRVDTVGVYDNVTPWTTHLPGPVTTMPQFFKDNGYHTVRLNKVFHGTDEHDDPKAWSEMFNMGTSKLGRTGESRNMTNGEVKWCSWMAANGTDEDQQDGIITTKAIDLMREKRDKPFFIALGLAKPHDPFEAPKKYFDMYNLNELMPPIVPDNRSPEDVYTIQSSWKDSFDKFTLQDKREYLRSYYACVSFMDAQIGRVMDALDEGDLWKDTAVFFIGDHGYNHGEHEWWNKNVLFDESCRVPMIAVVEGETKPNTVCDGFVELVDLYQTFADVCDLKAPASLEGVSFKPLLSNPDKKWKKAAFTQVKRGGNLHGRSIRTKRWRYTEWNNGKVIARELYDHSSDPGEYRNLAEMDDFADVCAEMSKILKKGENKFE